MDRGTQDVPGSPAIAQTIFEKIDHCQLFLCDVTITTGRPLFPLFQPELDILDHLLP